jgi:hypothetical protein
MSELYRYKSALPFMMTSRPRLRNNGVFFWDLLVTLKLWLEVMLAEALTPRIMADLVKVTRHRLQGIHKLDIPSLETRWRVLNEIGIIDTSRRGLSDRTKSIFQSMRSDPLSMRS